MTEFTEYEPHDELPDGRRSFWLHVEMGTAITAKDEQDARRIFADLYLKDVPGGDFGWSHINVTKGPPFMLKRTDSGDEQ